MAEPEERLEGIFQKVRKLLGRIENEKEDNVADAQLGEAASSLKEGRALVWEFEREKRADGVPEDQVAFRKSELLKQLNELISSQKDAATKLRARMHLVGSGAAGGGGHGHQQAGEGKPLEQMTVQELMGHGRKEIAETDAALDRAQKLVDDTIVTATKTADTVQQQTKQMEGIVNDLNDIEFSMKKASALISDITRGLMTDRCILCMVLLVILSVLIIIVLNLAGVTKKDKDDGPVSQEFSNEASRKLLLDLLQEPFT